MNTFVLATRIGFALMLGASASAQIQFVINSPAEALCTVRDLNADARRELVLGVPSSGKVQIHSGASGASMLTITGGLPSTSAFGTSIDVVADLDLDGFDDLIVGAPNSGTLGQVLIVSSTTGAVLRSFGPLGPTPITCPAQKKSYGFSVKSIGDLNGDGFSDYAIGAPGWEGAICIDQGIVEIVDVRPVSPTLINVLNGATLNTNGPWACPNIHDVQFGYSIGALGDGNGDGLPEIVVGAPGADIGVAFDGATCVVGGTPVVTGLIKGGQTASLGVSMWAIGDLDGDSVGDLVVGAPNLSMIAPNLATTYRFSGQVLASAGGSVVPPIGAVGLGAALGRQLGWSIARTRDVNGDGVPDYIAGAGSPCNAIPGAHYVFSGINGGLLQFVTHPSSPTYGQAVFSTGNVDPSGRPTFMVADPVSSQVTIRA